MRRLMLVAALALSACATGPQEGGWTSGKDAQPFQTAVAACSQSSYNVDTDFTICMAGRGWSRLSK
ncbi:MAG: hypothetical protein KJ833_01065 [Alphaproteobacteria bacterium]|nr:hypothetical protein [Alphaproteobacteria bacterium]